MELMDKVRQVGESYELNKYKTLNRTIELDARLANDRLLATKLRLNQVNTANEKLSKQLRQAQQQVRDQEKKILVSETMLRQFVGDDGGGAGLDVSRASHLIRSSASLATPKQSTGSGGGPKWSRSNRLAGRFRGGGGKKSSTSSSKVAAASQQTSSANETNSSSAAATADRQSNSNNKQLESSGGCIDETPKSNDNKTNYDRRDEAEAAAAERTRDWTSSAGASLMAGAALKSRESSQVRQVSSSATQTAPPSRTRAIINELRQRLNLAVGGAGPAAAKTSSSIDTKKQMAAAATATGDNQKHDVAIQTPNNDTTTTLNHYVDGDGDSNEDDDEDDDDDDEEDLELRYEEDSDYVDDDGRYLSSYDLLTADLADRRRGGGRRQQQRPRRGSVRPSDGAKGRPLRSRRVSFIKRRSISLDAILNNSLVHELPGTGEQIIISRGWPASAAERQQLAAQQRHRGRHHHHKHHHKHHRHHKHHHQHLNQLSPGRRPSSSVAIVQRRPSSTHVRRHQKISSDQKRSLLVEFLSQTSANGQPGKLAAADDTSKSGQTPAVLALINQAAKKDPPPSKQQALIVQYELPTYSGGPIQLGESAK